MPNRPALASLALTALSCLLMGCPIDPEQSPPSHGTWRSGFIQYGPHAGRAVDFLDVDGEALFEGDIHLGPTEAVLTPPLAGVVVISGDAARWPEGLIPFRIDPEMEFRRASIEEAMGWWEDSTPIRFIERTAGNSFLFPDFVSVVPGNGCSSNIGRRTGEQFVWLNPGCSVGAIAHELGHTVGLWHEQAREDRDEYVEINYPNIVDGASGNFDQRIANGDDIGPYDYGSIMHYAATAFSDNGTPTIIPRDPEVSIGQRLRLSPLDIAGVIELYGDVPADDATLRGWRSNGWPFRWNLFKRLSAWFSDVQHWKTGDFDGDGQSDWLLVYPGARSKASLFLYLSQGDTADGARFQRLEADFWPGQRWEVGNFDGDERDDLVLIYGDPAGNARSWMYHYDGSRFVRRSIQSLSAYYADHQHWKTGDFDRDGRDDLLLVYPGGAEVKATTFVYRSLGSSFAAPDFQRLEAGFWDSQRWEVGDFDADGRDDLLLLYDYSGSTRSWIFRSDGSNFVRVGIQTLPAFYSVNQHWLTGDVDGDERDDLVLVYQGSGQASSFVFHSLGTGFEAPVLDRLGGTYRREQRWMLSDQNADGRADLSMVYDE